MAFCLESVENIVRKGEKVVFRDVLERLSFSRSLQVLIVLEKFTLIAETAHSSGQQWQDTPAAPPSQTIWIEKKNGKRKKYW